jgi:hypothetical protein
MMVYDVLHLGFGFLAFLGYDLGTRAFRFGMDVQVDEMQHTTSIKLAGMEGKLGHGRY